MCYPADIIHLPLNYPATKTKLEIRLFADLAKMATPGGVSSAITLQSAHRARFARQLKNKMATAGGVAN